MIPDEMRLVILPPQLDHLKGHQVSHKFHQELQYRQELARHCHWYERTAQQHRQELQKMRRDINILGWFNGRGSAH